MGNRLVKGLMHDAALLLGKVGRGGGEEVSAFRAPFFPGSNRHKLFPALVIAGYLPA